MAFLEVITRAYARPNMLEANRRSVERLGDDVKHTLLYDGVGRGIPWAQEQLEGYAPYLKGDYIWILDDDDRCDRDTLVDELKAIVVEHDPDVIMVRMNHGPRGILPRLEDWGELPRCALIGCSAYIVKREVFQRHASAWSTGRYESDYDFIASVFSEDGIKVYWHEVIASNVQRISYGEAA